MMKQFKVVKGDITKYAADAIVNAANTSLFDNLKRLKTIADIGLLYAKDEYDTERYEEIKAISLDLMSRLLDEPITTVKGFYKQETDYPTPKVDVRAFVLNEKQEILMVQEQADGLWSLPGGWADIGFSPSEVAVKEVKEETGLDVAPLSMVAVFDKKCHPHPPQAYYVYKIVIHCKILTTNLLKGFDILDTAFFAVDDLPPLSTHRILKSQIEAVFNHIKEGKKEAIFD